MKYIINNLVFLLLIMCTFSYSITKAQVVLDANYNLVFDENFSGTALDVTKWNTSYPWGQMSGDGTFNCGNGSWDIAGYSLDPTDTNNVKVNNGSVKLIGTKETYKSPIMTWPSCPSTICTANNAPCGVNAYPNNCFVWDTTTFKYRNGMLESTHKFLYGYYEMKWRLPNWTASTNNVFTPTFWLFGGDSTAKWSEIDIFEIRGTNGLYVPNVHVIGGNNPNDTVPTSDYDTIFSNTPTVNLANWHTSSVLWTPDSIVFYLDSVSIDVTKRDTNKYLVPMQIIIENGLPALNFCIDSINSSTPLPVTYELDYVKVWQPAMACDTNKTYLTGTPTNYVSKHYQSLTLGGSGGNFVFNSGNGLGYGVDYVLLNAGTEISGTGIFQADVLPCWQKMPSFNQSVSNPTPMPPNYLKMFKHAHSNY